jgi:hypothetical protein
MQQRGDRAEGLRVRALPFFHHPFPGPPSFSHRLEEVPGRPMAVPPAAELYNAAAAVPGCCCCWSAPAAELAALPVPALPPERKCFRYSVVWEGSPAPEPEAVERELVSALRSCCMS